MIVAFTAGVLVYGRSSRANHIRSFARRYSWQSLSISEFSSWPLPSLRTARGSSTGRWAGTASEPPAERGGEPPIAGTEGAVNPVFSPDGNWLAFFVGPALKKVSFAGGAVATVATLPRSVGAQGYRGAAWADDGTIAFARRPAGLFGVPDRGGEARPLTAIDPNANERATAGRISCRAAGRPLYREIHQPPVVRRRADRGPVAGYRGAARGGAGGLRAISADRAHGLARAGGLYAVPFDAGRLAVMGAPVKVADDVTTHPESGGAQVAISRTGTLVYAAGGSRTAERPLLWVDRSGAARPVADRQASFFWPRISPDGRRIAVVIDAALSKIWVLDVERGTFTRASSLAGDQDRAVWMPDGVHLTFAGDTPAPARAACSRTGPMAVAAPRSSRTALSLLRPLSWSPDGRKLLFRRIGAPTGLGRVGLFRR